MPKNKRESLIFTIMMCAFMVFVMSVYNISFYVGFSFETVKSAWVGFPLAFIVAFILDWFFVGKFAKKFAFKLAGNNSKPIVLVLLISTFMVCGMVIFMSLFGALHTAGISSLTIPLWVENIFKNFILALPLQLLVAGPLIRYVFRKTFPEGTVC